MFSIKHLNVNDLWTFQTILCAMQYPFECEFNQRLSSLFYNNRSKTVEMIFF